MKNILEKLYAQEYLSEEEASNLLTGIVNKEFNDPQIASILTVFIMRPINSTELIGFQNVLLDMAIPFETDGQDTIDVCGTGGDGKNSFNISTLSAFVIAGAGYKVVKHGNYGVSSLCGSSNVLEDMGVQFTNDKDKLKKQLDVANICFLHAPLFHPAMKAVAPLRKALGVRTFFNMLGPLVNPARPNHQLTGVFSLELGRIYNKIQSQNNRNFSVIHSIDGYDEISLTGPFKYFNNTGEGTIHPEDYNLKRIVESDIYGGNTVAESVGIFKNVLQNKATAPQKEVVLCNSATAINCFDFDKSFQDCYEEAKKSIESGAAEKAFVSMGNV